MDKKKKKKKKNWTVSVAIHGHEHYGGIPADTEEEAIAEFWKRIHSDDPPKPEHSEQEFGFAGHTGWEVATASKED